MGCQSSRVDSLLLWQPITHLIFDTAPVAYKGLCQPSLTPLTTTSSTASTTVVSLVFAVHYSGRGYSVWHNWPAAGAVIDEVEVDGPLRSTLRSRAADVDVEASSRCDELNAVCCWSNTAGPGPGGSWIGRAGMSMCSRLIAGLNRSSLRSIGLSVTL